MALFKCKVCGGHLQIKEGQGICVCEYCGTKQTLPKLNDEKIINMYDRANHFRRNNEFDKAQHMYENILTEDPTDSEAYWSILLCKYGVEYVEDPKTKQMVITCNRTHYSSILLDEDYKKALQYASENQKKIYQNDAKTIDDIQKKILEISSKEDAFDIFICYKETDNRGMRTLDSVLANDIYHRLIDEGYRVFFSRISLEDKIGTAYEPYIFAALNSAKVMIVLGTHKDHFKGVWVKNEWLRFLHLIHSGEKKTLIPAYKDMDPYDLPEEFAHLQALDMSNIGFIVDLVHGIKKIISDTTSKKNTDSELLMVNQQININALLNRMFMLLEDGDFVDAKLYSDRILDLDHENAKAYIGDFMTDYKLRHESQIADLDRREYFDNHSFNRAIRYADKDYKEEILNYKQIVFDRIQYAEDTKVYEEAMLRMQQAREGINLDGYKEAYQSLQSILNYKNASELIKECQENIEEPRYQEAIRDFETSITKNDFLKTRQQFVVIEDYKQSKEYVEKCTEQYYQLYHQEIKDLIKKVMPTNGYRKLSEMVKDIQYFDDNPRIAITNIYQMVYDLAYQLENHKSKILLKDALMLYQTIPDFGDSTQHIQEIQNRFNKGIIKKTKTIIKEIIKNKKTIIIEKIRNRKIISSVVAFLLVIVIVVGIIIYKNDVAYQEKTDLYVQAEKLELRREYYQAIVIYEQLGDFKNSSSKKETIIKKNQETMYQQGIDLVEEGKYQDAYQIFSLLDSYKDATRKKVESLAMIRNHLPKRAVESYRTQVIALKKDGTPLVSYGDNTGRVDLKSWHDITQIDMSMEYTIGLKSDGTVSIAGTELIEWFENDVRTETDKWNNIIEVASDSSGVYGLQSNGKVKYAGRYLSEEDELHWTNIVSISAGSYGVFGVRANGMVVTDTSFKDRIDHWRDIVSISPSNSYNNFVVGLKSDGRVVTTSNDKEVDSWRDIVAVVAGDHHIVGLKADGTVVATGRNNEGQLNVDDWTDIVAITAGDYHTVGVKGDGTLLVASTVVLGNEIKNWTDVKTTNH